MYLGGIARPASQRGRPFWSKVFLCPPRLESGTAAFDVGHQPVEVRDVGLVKGLGEFGDDELAPTGNLVSNRCGSVFHEKVAPHHNLKRVDRRPGTIVL